ncbi:MAG: HEAT repeat domain-containing protein [Alphaproteobacteria bacterium]|nr:HEAT repeat domain-containing protein [Alphaproteobacteria bacterium]
MEERVLKNDKNKHKHLLQRLKSINPIFFPEKRNELFAELSLFVKDNREIRDALIKIVDETSSSHMLECALIALSPVSCEKEIFDKIKYNAGHDDFLIRRAAIKSLSYNVNNENVQKCLLQELGDEFSYADVRRNIVQALSPVSHRKNIKEALLNSLNDDDFFVRESALKSLSSEINDERVFLAVKQKLKDSDSDVVKLALKYISKYSKDHLLVTSKSSISSNIYP